MSTFYTKTQMDAIAAIIGNRITIETDPTTLKNAIEALSGVNFFSDAEKTKLASLDTNRFFGTYATLAAIPTAGAEEGMYAHVDSGSSDSVKIAYWDNDGNQWVEQGNAASETAGSIKTKYESNPDTNAFTDAQKSKLDGIGDAPSTVDFVAALDGAIT